MSTPARRHDVGDIRCLDGFLMPQAAAPSASPELHEPNLANAESESLPRSNTHRRAPTGHLLITAHRLSYDSKASD